MGGRDETPRRQSETACAVSCYLESPSMRAWICAIRSGRSRRSGLLSCGRYPRTRRHPEPEHSAQSNMQWPFPFRGGGRLRGEGIAGGAPFALKNLVNFATNELTNLLTDMLTNVSRRFARAGCPRRSQPKHGHSGAHERNAMVNSSCARRGGSVRSSMGEGRHG